MNYNPGVHKRVGHDLMIELAHTQCISFLLLCKANKDHSQTIMA